MYTSVYYDRFNEYMFYWLTDGSRGAKKVKHRFYTPVKGQYGAMPCNMVDIYGNEMYECIVSGRDEANFRNDNMGRYNLLSECDVDFRTRWLDNFYKGEDDLRFNIEDFNICYLDIEVESPDRFPEQNLAEYPVNCVTIYFSKLKKYYVFARNRDLKPETLKKLEENNADYINCPTETDLITSLYTKIADNNVDILTAYHAAFDITYLVNRSSKLIIDLKLLSRLPYKYKSAYISKRDEQLKIGGTEIIDYLGLYKKFTLKERDDFKLDTIGELEVGERKAPLPDGYKSWQNYWDDWVWYNFKDVELMTKIEEKRKLFETTISACAEARVTFDSIFETKKMLVGFIMNYLHQNNIVMPPLRENVRESFPGAYVYAAMGYYTNLVSGDFRAMYPTFIKDANVSPETKVIKLNGKFYDSQNNEMDVTEDALVRSPWGANGKYEVFYRKDIKGIIPKVTERIFDGRTALKDKMKSAKRAGNFDEANVYDTRQQAYKIFGNGLYGLLGNPYFQFYDIDNSATITAYGVKLITYTIEKLCYYFENVLEKDERYFKAFGEYPVLDDKLKGTFVNADEHVGYNRLSHGDTDSFFVKYDDIYKSFGENVGKKVSVYVFDSNRVVFKNEYDLSSPDAERKSKLQFNYACTEYCPNWKDISDEDKKKTFRDGIFTQGNIRIIYNRYCLTDYCRILDAALMEDVFAKIMQEFADNWSLKQNTIYLKREKCVNQSIVTAKKKYICNVESDEDIKIFDDNKKFKITGLEIVRSSTTPFARKYLLSLIKELLKNMDKNFIRERYVNIKKEFYDMIEEEKYYDISIPSGMKTEPPKYTDYENWPDADRKKLDWRPRAASVWNHLIENDELLKDKMLEPIYANTKVKFIKVTPNKFGLNSIAFIGDNCPKELFNVFNPNWNEQWEKTFANIMDRLFIAIGWGKNFENDQTDLMMELF